MKALSPLIASSLLVLAACASVETPTPEPWVRPESPAPSAWRLKCQS